MRELADIGKLINNRYEIKEEIGRGGMGHVHKVIDIRDGRILAAKFLTSEMLENKRTIIALKNEFKLAKRFDHGNVVKIYDFIYSQDNYYLIMDYIEGRDLRKHLREGRLSLEDKLEIVIGACLGLLYMHEGYYVNEKGEGKGHPILHGDIKPENVMIREGEKITRENIVWTDFGFSVLERKSLFHKKRMRGTPLYMSPEQIRGDKLDIRSDLYSLGALSYEIYAGRPPFLSSLQEKHFQETGKFQYDERKELEMAKGFKKGYIEEITTKHLHSGVKNPGDFDPTIPAGIEHIIMKCLQKQRKKRPNFVYEILSVLYRLERLSGQ
ncbi:serine/threonine protein kinase [candidate division NPL-UPA2 bacterium]|nr:serine/threonine protein kinase [candidate division NPL-UPA2 bacterium]